MRNDLRDQAEKVVDIVGRDGTVLVHDGRVSDLRAMAGRRSVVVAIERAGFGWMRSVVGLSRIAPTVAIWVPRRWPLSPSVEALRRAFLAKGYRINPRTVLFPRSQHGTWIGFERMPGDALVAHAELAAADLLRRPLPEAMAMLDTAAIMAKEIRGCGKVTVFGSGTGCSTWALAALANVSKMVGLEHSYDLLDYALCSYATDTTAFEPVGRGRRDGGKDDAFVVIDPLPSTGDYADVGYRAEKALSPDGRLVVCIPEKIVDCDTGRTNPMDVDLLGRMVGPAFHMTHEIDAGFGAVCVSFEKTHVVRDSEPFDHGSLTGFGGANTVEV
jgi:hypothetical protein